jgi:hypothetical protein
MAFGPVSAVEAGALAMTAADVETTAAEAPAGATPPATKAAPSPAPVTGAPVTGAPVTGAPVTGAPVTGAPVRGAPVRGAPGKAAPGKAAPVEDATVEAAPVEAAPVEAATKESVTPALAATGRRELDLSTPLGVVQANRRIWCTMTDNQPVYWFWRGDVYSRRQGEPDKLLFKVEGLNTRTCATMNDPAKGGQFVRSTSREILLYLDPTTGEVLKTWNNPWTGDSVDVLHVANDPVNGEFTQRTRAGQPATWRGSTIGASWFLTTTIPLFYANPLAGAFQDEVGGKYHATEMFNFMGEKSNLVDLRLNSADATVSWARISDWLPWMKMGDREGMLYFHTGGRKLLDWNDVSPLMRAEVERHYPEYRTPPPIADARPNETSWTYYLKVQKGEITPPKR